MKASTTDDMQPSIATYLAPLLGVRTLPPLDVAFAHWKADNPLVLAGESTPIVFNEGGSRSFMHAPPNVTWLAEAATAYTLAFIELRPRDAHSVATARSFFPFLYSLWTDCVAPAGASIARFHG